MDGDPLRHDLAAGDVVLKEKRLGAARDQVVGDHRDQVDPDGVVQTGLLRDGELRPHPVGRGSEQRLAVAAGVEGEQAGKSTQVTDHLGAVGATHGRAHQLDRAVAGVDIDTGLRVRGALLRPAHGRRSASAPPGLAVRVGSAWPCGAGCTLLPMPSSRCLPIMLSSGSGMG